MWSVAFSGKAHASLSSRTRPWLSLSCPAAPSTVGDGDDDIGIDLRNVDVRASIQARVRPGCIHSPSIVLVLFYSLCPHPPPPAPSSPRPRSHSFPVPLTALPASPTRFVKGRCMLLVRGGGLALLQLSSAAADTVAPADVFDHFDETDWLLPEEGPQDEGQPHIPPHLHPPFAKVTWMKLRSRTGASVPSHNWCDLLINSNGLCRSRMELLLCSFADWQLIQCCPRSAELCTVDRHGILTRDQRMECTVRPSRGESYVDNARDLGSDRGTVSRWHH